MKKGLLFGLLLVGLVAAFSEEEYQDAFVSWMHEQDKSYTSEEFFHRYNAFKDNMDYIKEWNNAGSPTVLGLTSLADLINDEYQSIYLGTHIEVSSLPAYEMAEPVTGASKDWRSAGAVTGIKNQGQCGSCWSFSATGAIEGIEKIKAGKLVSLSEQNLIDCSVSFGNHGCNGGNSDSAFKYVIQTKGIDTEASYPYTGKDGGKCEYKSANSGATISGHKEVPANNENALVSAINGQPVSVAIDASQKSFQLYKTGVYYEKACSSTKLDHGVLAIGYTDDHYIVKNSWGTGWGQEGYIFMSRNKNNNCGIATSACYPTK